MDEELRAKRKRDCAGKGGLESLKIGKAKLVLVLQIRPKMLNPKTNFGLDYIKNLFY